MDLNLPKPIKRFLMIVALLSFMSQISRAVWAQTYTFQPSDQPLQQSVDVAIAVEGKVKMKTTRFGVVEENVKVTGSQSFEQWLGYQRATQLCRAVRYYHDLQSKVSIGEGQVKPALRMNRKLIVDQYQFDQHHLYSPQGKLTRDELDLVNTQLSPTLFYQLLPQTPVNAGDSWELDSAHLSAILALDAVAQNDVKATLKSVENGQAVIVCQGEIAGGVNGVLTEVQLTLQALYDISSRSFSKVSLDMTERRGIGHARPGLDVSAKVVVKSTPLNQFIRLNDSIIQKCNRPMTDRDALLSLVPVADAIELELSRDWHVMMDQPELLVMRQVIRGDLISQCSLSRLKPLGDNQRMTVELLKQQIQKSLGERLAEFTETHQEPLHGKYPHLRVSAVGLVGEVTFQWVYHHVTDVKGNQYLFVFTIPNDKVSQFGLQDRQVVKSFVFRNELSGKQPIPASASTDTTKR